MGVIWSYYVLVDYRSYFMEIINAMFNHITNYAITFLYWMPRFIFRA